MVASRPTPLRGDWDTLEFLTAAFGAKDDAWYVVLWELAGKQSASFTDLAAAASWAAGRNDVYYHVGLTKVAFEGGHRPKALEIDGMIGCWADLDIAHPVHSKQGLPADEAAAWAVARATGLEPSIVIQS